MVQKLSHSQGIAQTFKLFMTNLTLKVKITVTSFKHTHLNFEAKIRYDSKVVAFTRNYTKSLSFKANLTSKVKITSFQIKNIRDI